MTISQNNSLTDFQIFKITFSQNHRIAQLQNNTGINSFFKGCGDFVFLLRVLLFRKCLNYIKVKIFLFFKIFISILVIKVGVAD